MFLEKSAVEHNPFLAANNSQRQIQMRPALALPAVRQQLFPPNKAQWSHFALTGLQQIQIIQRLQEHQSINKEAATQTLEQSAQPLIPHHNQGDIPHLFP